MFTRTGATVHPVASMVISDPQVCIQTRDPIKAKLHPQYQQARAVWEETVGANNYFCNFHVSYKHPSTPLAQHDKQ